VKGAGVRKFRKVCLGLGVAFTAISLLALAGVHFIIPFLNPVAMCGALLFMLLFALTGIRRRQDSAKRILMILLAVLCVAAIVCLSAVNGLYWYFFAMDNIGKVYPSPSGLHQMFVRETWFVDYDDNVYPIYFGCFYVSWLGKHSDGRIDQFRWKNNHTVEVLLGNTATIDGWWRYNFWTMRWEIAEIV